MAAGTLVGWIEISITFPLEFIKRQLQLQQQAAGHLARNARCHRFHVGAAPRRHHRAHARRARSVHRLRAAHRASPGSRSAIRFFAFEQLSAASRRAGVEARNHAASDTACGFGAGLCEAALAQTPNQAISTKMLTTRAPPAAALPQLFHATRSIYAEHGFWRGFFCGLEPAVIKGAATNCIRFPTFGAIKRLMQRRDGADPAAPLPPSQAIVAGGLAGAISAVVTQPIDTVMAQAQGLESAKFRNTSRARDIVRAGGVRALYFGLSTRTARVFCEVGLQFSLYEQISPWLDRALG